LRIAPPESLDICRFPQCCEASRAHAVEDRLDCALRRWSSFLGGPVLRCRLAISLAAHLAKTRSAAWGAAAEGTMLTNRARPNELGARTLDTAATFDLILNTHGTGALDIGGGDHAAALQSVRELSPVNCELT
jgi:hypothetical protein